MYFTRVDSSFILFVIDESALRRPADKQQELSLFRSRVMAAQAAELHCCKLPFFLAYDIILDF
jgi:hypothetical protein